MGQEVFGVEHIQLMLSGKGVGQELIGLKRRPVLGVQEPVFAGWNGNHLFIFDLINDVDQKPRMPARGENLSLWALFSVRRDNVLAGKRGRPVNLVEHAIFLRSDAALASRR